MEYARITLHEIGEWNWGQPGSYELAKLEINTHTPPDRDPQELRNQIETLIGESKC